MRLLSWNVNGIRAVIRKENFYELIDAYDPDILCIQESKAQPEQVSLDLPYYQYWNSADKKGYSGTVLLSKEEPLQVWYGFSPEIAQEYTLVDDYGDTTREGRVITAEYEQFFVVTVYTPNAKEDLTRIPMRKEWDSAFLDHCQQCEQKKPVIFCGDLNVAHTPEDLARPKENEGNKGFTKEERAGFQKFLNAGYVDTFRMFYEGNGYYSWFSYFGKARERNVGWRIDYVLVSANLVSRVKDGVIHDHITGSDHCPVGIDID